MGRIETGDKYSGQGETKELKHVTDAMNIVRLGEELTELEECGTVIIKRKSE